MTVWDKILEAELAAAKRYPKLWDGTSESEIKNILTYYGLHGGLFYSIEDGEVTAVMLAHPGCKLPDWEWDELTNDWTILTAWAKNRKALEDMTERAIQDKKPDLIYAIRDGNIHELTTKKLLRLFYGILAHHPSSSSTTVQRVHEGSPQGSD
jgi:hypothetical protein